MSLNDLMTAHANAFRAKTGVTDKLSIARMTQLLDDLSWNKKNLLEGTSDQWRTLTGDGWLGVTTASNAYIDITNFGVGEHITYAFDVNNTSSVAIESQLWLCDENKNRLTGVNGAFVMSDYYYPGTTNRVIASIENIAGAKYLQIGIYSQSGTAPAGSQIQVKGERLYVGTEAGVWTPNPADKVAG